MIKQQPSQKPPPSNLKLIATALGLDRTTSSNSALVQRESGEEASAMTTSPKVLPSGLKRGSLSKETSWTEIAARMDALNRSSSLGSSPSKSVLPDLAIKRRSSETVTANSSPQKRPTSEDSERFYDCSEGGDAEPPSKKKAGAEEEEQQQPAQNKHLVSRLQGNPRLRYWDSADHNMPPAAPSSSQVA